MAESNLTKMKYAVKVKPGSTQEKVIETDGGLVVYLHARPHDGEANRALIDILAKYFGVSKSEVKVVRGAHSREKVIEI